MRRAITFLAAIACAMPIIASAASCPALVRGSQGAAVSAVQQILFDSYQGFPPATGYFGPVTEAAVKQWQGEHGIERVGIVGPQTAAAMKIDLCASSASTSDKQSLINTLLAQVKALQSQLALLIANGKSVPAIITSTSASAPSTSGGTPPSTASSGGGGTSMTNPLPVSGGGGTSGSTACTFNGASIANGTSVTAYQAASVAAGASCVSQTRTCTNGALSGSYAFASCAVQQLATNLVNGAVCTGASQCASGYCYPGPENLKYCIARNANCAKPSADGVMFGDTYLYNGSAYACLTTPGLVKAANVRDFGALGDGTTDDTAAVQQAFGASAAVYLPTGTYRVRELAVPASLAMIFSYGGMSGGRFLQSTANNNVLSVVNSPGLSVNGVGFIGDSANGGSSASHNSGIDITTSSHIVVKDSAFTGFRYLGVIARGSTDVTVANNDLYQNYQGIMCQGSSAMTISGNSVRDPLYGNAVFTIGIHLDSTDGQPYGVCKNVTISGNTVSNFTNAQSIMGHAGQNILVENNTIQNTSIGISFNPYGNLTSDIADLITIRGNTITGTSVAPPATQPEKESAGIFLGGGPTNLVTNSLIENNTVTNANAGGLDDRQGGIGLGYSSNVEVRFNTINHSFGGALFVNNPSTSADMHDNTIDGVWPGQSIAAGVRLFKSVDGRLWNNHINNASYGLYEDVAVPNLSIQGNTCTSCTVPGF